MNATLHQALQDAIVREVGARARAARAAAGLSRKRLAELFDHARLTAPEKRGTRYFFMRNAGLDNQAVLVVRDGVDGTDRTVIDPGQPLDVGDGVAVHAHSRKDGDGHRHTRQVRVHLAHQSGGQQDHDHGEGQGRDKGRGLEGAQAALGHARAATTEIYAELTEDRARAIADDL